MAGIDAYSPEPDSVTAREYALAAGEIEVATCLQLASDEARREQIG